MVNISGPHKILWGALAIDGKYWEGRNMVRKEKSAAATFEESAVRVEWVEVTLRDGRTLQGNVIRNPIRRTGTVVNAVDETRHDFALDEIRSVRKVGDPRSPSLS